MAPSNLLPTCYDRLAIYGLVLMAGGGTACTQPSPTAITGHGAIGVFNRVFGGSGTGNQRILDCSQMNAWWVSHSSDFVVRAQKGDFLFELRYLPAVCTACREHRSSTLRDSVLQERVRELAGTSSYAFRISTAKSGLVLPEEAYVQAQAWERVGTDTVPCVFAHVEAAPAITPYRTYLLAFDHPQDGRDREVHIDDPKQRIGGPHVFRFAPGTFALLHRSIKDTTSPQ